MMKTLVVVFSTLAVLLVVSSCTAAVIDTGYELRQPEMEPGNKLGTLEERLSQEDMARHELLDMERLWRELYVILHRNFGLVQEKKRQLEIKRSHLLR